MNPIIQFLIGPVLQLIEKFIPDPNQKAQLQMQLLQMEASEEFKNLEAQIDVDKQEAESTNLFVSGWRPAVGWVCVVAFGVQFLVAPIATWAAALLGHKEAIFPTLDMATMMPVLLGMLGLGTMRTVEKVQGVTK